MQQTVSRTSVSTASLRHEGNVTGVERVASAASKTGSGPVAPKLAGYKKHGVGGFFLMASLFWPLCTPAKADPVTITSGLAMVAFDVSPYVTNPSLAFDFSASALHLSYAFHNPPLPIERVEITAPSLPSFGSVADFSSDATFSTMGLGSGEFHFAAAPALLQCSDDFDEFGFCPSFSHFVFSGSIIGFVGNETGSVMHLRGRGTVLASVNPNRIHPMALTYYFEATPVPEPATLMLLGSGLAALLRRQRVARKS